MVQLNNMTKTKKTYQTYCKYAYVNLLGELSQEILRMENFREYDTNHDTFGDGWNECIERVIKLIEEQK